MTKCAKFEDIIARYLHGKVLLQEQEELEKHLSVCPDCERIYTKIAQIDRLLRHTPGKSVDPPAHLRGKILANLPEKGRTPAWQRPGRWAAAAGFAAACGLLFFAIFQGGAPRDTREASSGPVKGQLQVPAPAPPAPAKPSAGKADVASIPRAKIQVIREVKIYFYYPPATQVAVTGDFNAWNPKGVALKAAGKPGLWETTLRLKPGAYSYNFIVDGNVLLPDPNAPDQMPDGYGGTNSILLVKGGNSV